MSNIHSTTTTHIPGMWYVSSYNTIRREGNSVIIGLGSAPGKYAADYTVGGPFTTLAEADAWKSQHAEFSLGGFAWQHFQ